VERSALRIGEDHLLGVEAELGRYLIAVPVGKQNERIQ
jgi:hypothetical protein